MMDYTDLFYFSINLQKCLTFNHLSSNSAAVTKTFDFCELLCTLTHLCFHSVCYSFNIGFVSRWPRWAAPLSSLPSCNFGSLPLCWMRFQSSSCLRHPAAVLEGCLSLFCTLKLFCFCNVTTTGRGLQ